MGREEERRAILTVLVDTSGSMNQPDRIGLVKQSLNMLLAQLGEGDEVAIVQYGSAARLALDHTPVASQRKQIAAAISSLQCNGSTALEAGLGMAYRTAASHFVSGAENRVLILSDGVANIGEADAVTIVESVSKFREQGIFCSASAV